MQTISDNLIMHIGAASTLCFIVPFLALMAYKKNTRAPIRPCVYGIIFYLAFSGAFTQIFHTLVLGWENPLSRLLQDSMWAYIIYGSLVSAVFEGVARFVSFRMLQKDYSGPTTAIMYGIGHGGAEVITVGAVALLNTMLMATSLNAVGVDGVLAEAGEMTESIQTSINMLLNTPAETYYISTIERIISFGLQVALSVLVYCGVAKPELRWCFPVSMVLHFLAYVLTGFYQTGLITSVYLLEGLVLAYTAAVAVFAWILYRKHIKVA